MTPPAEPCRVHGTTDCMGFITGAGWDCQGVPDAMSHAYNALAWIHHLASIHYMGGAFEPEHMRGIANLALEALHGKEMPDFDTAMAKARESARDALLKLDLKFDGEGIVDITHGDDDD